MIKKIETISAIVGIVILEIYALLQGINGTGIALAIAALAGLGGYKLREIIPIKG